MHYVEAVVEAVQVTLSSEPLYGELCGKIRILSGTYECCNYGKPQDCEGLVVPGGVSILHTGRFIQPHDAVFYPEKSRSAVDAHIVRPDPYVCRMSPFSTRQGCFFKQLDESLKRIRIRNRGLKNKCGTSGYKEKQRSESLEKAGEEGRWEIMLLVVSNGALVRWRDAIRNMVCGMVS